MSEYMEKLRPQVEGLIRMLDHGEMSADVRAFMRRSAAASIETSERCQEITREERDELMKLLYPFEVEIFPDERQ